MSSNNNPKRDNPNTKATVMALLALLALLGLAGSGCDEAAKDTKASADGKETSSAAPRSNAKDDKPKMSGLDGTEPLKLAEAYADAVCACKKAQCINKAGETYNEDVNKLYADKKVRTPTPEQKKKMDAAQARVKECTDKLLKK